MIRFSSDFECGNGKSFTQLGPSRYRLEVVGDKPVYCYYYCFDVESPGEAAAIAVEVWHDPLINDVPGFISHFPGTVWVRAQGGPSYFHALDAACCQFHEDHLVLHLELPADRPLRVTNLWPCPCSDTDAFLEGLAALRADRCQVFSVGRSLQGRELTGIRTGTPGQPRLLCVAGQHPIEFSGTWGMRAVADFVTSRLPEAARIREHFEVEVVPHVNPDGAAAGRNGFNAEGLDMYRAFGAQPDAPEPEAHESRLLWRWACQAPPALWFNIHNYLGWRSFAEPPFDGYYTVPSSLYAEAAQQQRYEALCDAVRLLTDGPSGHLRAAAHEPNTLCYQLARRHGVPHVFYEINGSTGGAFASARRAVHVFRTAMGVLLP
ncbi:MAG: M14 family zinc carboxypeptidase [Candidatus Latescibacterota bacterium]